jgi:iron(II)-dependent oxidoreductase
MLALTASAQSTKLIREGTFVNAIQSGAKTISIKRPIVTYQVGGKTYDATQPSPVKVSVGPAGTKMALASINLLNTSRDTITVHNIVPFAPTQQDIFITGKGTHRLSRTHLFMPGRQPVNVIVPDNSWDLGYTSLQQGSNGVFGLTRRDDKSVRNGKTKRFENVLAPGGSITYSLYAELFEGDWHEGLKKCFQEKKLYDVESFDETMFNRQDLKWIQKAYVIHLMMAWDKDYYDAATGRFNWSKFLERGNKLYGGDDVICLWPTWPTLGLDQRNQFDMYRDLPGGLKALRALADTLRLHGTKFFIAYNPWDESTRTEGHLQGLADLIRETSADGVVLDTKGESSKELQLAADKVKPGVVMYSEGMAVPKDMPGIVSGRVHNALYYPPMLNLNKLIKPDFAIMRVAEVYKEPIQREYAVSFFNGYGTEINQFPPGHPEWEERQYLYLGRTTRILRENNANFTTHNFIPLISTTHDSVWVNYWPGTEKSLYTALSLKPEGFNGALFEIQSRKGYHWVDLWHHEPGRLIDKGGKQFVHADIDGFNAKDLGTNNEGQVTCLAEFRSVLDGTLEGNSLILKGRAGTETMIWRGDPTYDNVHSRSLLAHGIDTVDLGESFYGYDGKIVVQAFNESGLLDEIILKLPPGSARLTTRSRKTDKAATAPSGMVKVPGGKFLFKVTHGDNFIPYPTQGVNQTFDMRSFFMDRHPVTNKEFGSFLKATNYKPSDNTNFLKHWKDGYFPKGEENFPVVYVSYEDAKAYATWARKRLPTEIEWQYAAQTDKLNEWPWKQDKPVKRKNQYVTETLTVSALEGIDAHFCNLGDGNPYPVGKYPKGANPYGLEDLVGCVWQLTNDIYESGSYRYIMMKGGSYFKPSSSWWYVQGGPRELHYRQVLLRVSEGFERNATVGFRCVKDSGL